MMNKFLGQMTRTMYMFPEKFASLSNIMSQCWTKGRGVGQTKMISFTELLSAFEGFE
jgi:hypothetical protein